MFDADSDLEYEDRTFDEVNQDDIDRLERNFQVVQSILDEDLTGLFLSDYKQDFREILSLYDIYFKGADFQIDSTNVDWTPTKVRLNIIKILIDKTARYMFSQEPDIWIKSIDDSDVDMTPNEAFVKKVLKENHFESKIVKAAKDCLIGKRVALVTNINEYGIQVEFIPSLEFAYETDPQDVDRLTKFIHVYPIEDDKDIYSQKIYKKKWELINDVCYIEEAIYDGAGRVKETIVANQRTKFDYIPVSVIINDGLLGDPFGDSDINIVKDLESAYAKLISKDIDSLRRGTDEIVYTIDMDPKSTANLSRRPGAYWDLASDEARPERQGKAGSIDNPMTYAEGLTASLTRLRNILYTSLSVPDTTSSALQGIVTSGKTMQAIYWDLTTRCNEKMLAWTPALELCVRTILTSAKKYPEVKKKYDPGKLVEEYQVVITNNYSVLQDDIEERTTDLLEVQSNVRSRKSYLKKWEGLTDEEADEELEQIALEMQMLSEDSLMGDSYGNIEEASNGDIAETVESNQQAQEAELNSNNEIKGVKQGTSTANKAQKTTANSK